jgi:D-aminoacyl-tRNA deacylase
MKAIVQRVARGAVRVGGETVGAIGAGMVVLLGVMATDRPADADRLAERTARLRIFADAEGRMNRSLLDAGGEALVVSQFTLAGDTRKGHRPSFIAAAPPERAEALYERYAGSLRSLGVRVATGTFRAMMEVEILGDGPVTILLEEPRGDVPPAESET